MKLKEICYLEGKLWQTHYKPIKWNLIKFKRFCTTKETISKVKRQPSDWEKIIQSHYWAYTQRNQNWKRHMYTMFIAPLFKKLSLKWTIYPNIKQWDFWTQRSKWILLIWLFKFIGILICILNISSVQSLSHVWPPATPWTTAHQASLPITNTWNLPKLISIELVMPFNHLIFCHPLRLLP